MNWTTRFFVATLMVLATTVGYGAARAYNLRRQAFASNNLAQKAQFNGASAFDMQQIGGASNTYQSSGGKSTSKMSMAQASPAVTGTPPAMTGTPPAYHDDDQDEQGDQDENEQGDSGDAQGTVTAVNGNMVTINGQTYTLAPGQSEVNGYFQVGSSVKVEYYMNADGTMTIEELKVVNSSMYDKGSSNDSSNYQYNYNNNAPNNQYWCHDDCGGD